MTEGEKCSFKDSMNNVNILLKFGKDSDEMKAQ